MTVGCCQHGVWLKWLLSREKTVTKLHSSLSGTLHFNIHPTWERWQCEYGTRLGIRRDGFHSWLCHWPAVWPWAIHFPSLCLNFPICENADNDANHVDLQMKSTIWECGGGGGGMIVFMLRYRWSSPLWSPKICMGFFRLLSCCLFPCWWGLIFFIPNISPWRLFCSRKMIYYTSSPWWIVPFSHKEYWQACSCLSYRELIISFPPTEYLPCQTSFWHLGFYCISNEGFCIILWLNQRSLVCTRACCCLGGRVQLMGWSGCWLFVGPSCISAWVWRWPCRILWNRVHERLSQPLCHLEQILWGHGAM